jgi:hypothetical protein
VAALLEQGRSLGADQHGPLILAHQRRGGLSFSFSQASALPLQVQLLKLLSRIGRKVAARGLPERRIIQHNERADRGLELGGQVFGDRHGDCQYLQRYELFQLGLL